MTGIDNLFKGDIPPWIRRFVKQTGRTINNFNMIEDGEKVIIAISGGKDSLALALALSLRLKWLPINYTLYGVMINWKEYGITPQEEENLRNFMSAINIPLEIISASIYPESFRDKFNCYLCSRNRKRILFDYAEEHGISKIALGHHLDDFVETSIMNLCFRADFSTISPVQEFFNGKIHIIRPMCEVRESVIERVTKEYQFPVSLFNCPNKETNLRSKIKPLIKQLSHIDKLTREHIFAAHKFNDNLFKKD